MRFTIRPGSDPVARADATLLRALGLPSGGVVRIGRTHVLVMGGEVPEPTALLLGPQATTNAGVSAGRSVDVVRAVLPSARLVVMAGEALPGEGRDLVRALQGRPVSNGDLVAVDPGYLETAAATIALKVARVEPDGAGLVGAATRFLAASDPAATEPLPSVEPRPREGEAPSPPRGAPAGPSATTGSPPVEPATTGAAGAGRPESSGAPSTREALLAGLDAELDLLGGWLSLLTSPRDLPAAWGLPRVAGVLLEGPHGCGKSELVQAAAEQAGARVHEVSVDLVFKPERLLDLLETAVKTTAAPGVVFVDRLEAVAGEEGMAPFRTQVAAILRWFLDAVAGKPGLAAVLGVASRGNLDPAITRSPLLPRSLVIPPPDLTRRKLLFEAALARVPSEPLDFERLAGRSAGFSGADVVAAVIHASSRVARGGKLTTADVLAAVEETPPSLGSVPMGELPSFGFDKVADLAEVKQRLTEAVIWPITDPERFRAMGIDPPRGILLFGPPGTGKTFVVRALAKEAGAAFFSVKGAELLDKYVGESEKGVREVFARARAASPSIIFFDEIDALAPVRGRSTTSVTDSVVAALLTEIDGVSARGDVSVIGATNRRDLIDPALLRAGRFEIQIELGLPNAEARRALLDVSDVPFAGDVDLDRLAAATEGMSFADLSGVLREAALDALRADRAAHEVRWEHLTRAVERWFATRGEA
jgi:transitional endoplasmic reticulum ATPase